jgi:hypothetical protein
MTNSTPARQDIDPYEDRRAYPRVPIALPAFLQADGGRHSVQILDLSSGGAKLNCQAEIAVGTAVLLDCGTLACSAVVRWRTNTLLGLCFESELDVREISALMARSTALATLMKAR